MGVAIGRKGKNKGKTQNRGQIIGFSTLLLDV